MAPRPNMGAKNWNFLTLLKTMVVGALWFRLGLLSISILCFLKSDKNDGVTALRRGAKMCMSHKNDPKKPFFL